MLICQLPQSVHRWGLLLYADTLWLLCWTVATLQRCMHRFCIVLNLNFKSKSSMSNAHSPLTDVASDSWLSSNTAVTWMVKTVLPASGSEVGWSISVLVRWMDVWLNSLVGAAPFRTAIRNVKHFKRFRLLSFLWVCCVLVLVMLDSAAGLCCSCAWI